MKSTSAPAIVFAIFLAIWVQVAVADFDDLLEGIRDFLRADPNFPLPYPIGPNEIEALKRTSDEFKAACVAHHEAGNKPIMALIYAIQDRFDVYCEISDDPVIKNMLAWNIIPVNPIGFLVYLKGKDDSSSTDVARHVIDFYRRFVAPPPPPPPAPPAPPLGYNLMDEASTSHGDTLECPICQNRSPSNQWAQIHVCLHAFHWECLEKWIDRCGRNANCPCCRTPFRA